MSTVVGRYTRVEGVSTYYESAGEGPPMLCIHTAGRDCRQWHAFLEHYSNSFRVLAPDLPGHQKSAPLAGNRCIDDWRELVDFLWAFCDTLGARNPIVMGCSLGGNVAFALAQRRPAEVAALVSLEGADAGSPHVNFPLLDHPAVRVNDWFLPRQNGLIGSGASPEAREQLNWSLRQATPEVLLADLRMYQEMDVRTLAHSITCPCLLLRGEEDWIVPRERVSATAARLTGARLLRVVELPGAGHFPHQEVPERCFPIIDDFLAVALT